MTAAIKYPITNIEPVTANVFVEDEVGGGLAYFEQTSPTTYQRITTIVETDYSQHQIYPDAMHIAKIAKFTLQKQGGQTSLLVKHFSELPIDHIPHVQALGLIERGVLDTKISELMIAHLKKHCPNSYRSIDVKRKNNYQLSGHTEKKDVRIIRLEVHWTHATANFFKVLFTSQKEIANLTAASTAAIGSEVSTDIESLQLAYKRNYTFEMIYSFDGLEFSCSPIGSKVTNAAASCVIS